MVLEVQIPKPLYWHQVHPIVFAMHPDSVVMSRQSWDGGAGVEGGDGGAGVEGDGGVGGDGPLPAMGAIGDWLRPH